MAVFSNTDINFQEINIGKNVSYIDPRFKNTNYNGNINIDSENKYYEAENNIIYQKDENGNPTTLVRVQYEINGTMQIKSSVKEIGNSAFYGQGQITEITIPEGVETIRSGAFHFCSILQKVEIPSTIKTIESCFGDATNNLEEIIVHKAENEITGAPWGAVKGMKVVKWEP